MLGAVQLNHQLCSMTVKVNNKAANGFLPLKPHRIGTQKVIPKMIFLPCGILSEFLCTRNQFVFIWKRHRCSPFAPSVATRQLPLRGSLFDNKSTTDLNLPSLPLRGRCPTGRREQTEGRILENQSWSLFSP